MKGNLWQIAVVALALALFLPLVVNGAFTDAAQQRSSNETATVDYDDPYSVEQQDVVQYNSTITVAYNGTTLSEGDDYEWNTTSGEVEWLSSNSTTDGDQVFVDYGYEDHDDRTELVATILSWNESWIGLLLLIVALGTLKIMALGSGGF